MTSVSYKEGVGALRPLFAAYATWFIRDGLNRLFTIILSLLEAREGLLLIDEFENGLHHSVQLMIWQTIFQLSSTLMFSLCYHPQPRCCRNIPKGRGEISRGRYASSIDPHR